MAQLTGQNLTLGYEAHPVLKGLNFSVSKGDYLCIIGENGSGKTTLMKAILGLHAPLSGSLQTGDGLQAGQIGYLPQQTAAQRDFPACVEEIVLSGCQARRGLRPFYRLQEKQLAASAMERMGLSTFRKRSYRVLSGGQQQRVLLARALCAAQTMLLLDEPVAGLDPQVTDEMYHLIRDLNTQGVTILMVSHDVSVAMQYASHILHVRRGSAYFGTKEDYLKTEAGKHFLMPGGEPHGSDF